VHPTTVQRALKAGLGMSHCIAAKKPFLSTTHIRKRKIWAREALKLMREEWIRIIWTDESSVEVGKESRERIMLPWSSMDHFGTFMLSKVKRRAL
jgi:hypothetical protein